jgi:hypothetical protein
MLYTGTLYNEFETDWISLYRQFFRALCINSTLESDPALHGVVQFQIESSSALLVARIQSPDSSRVTRGKCAWPSVQRNLARSQVSLVRSLSSIMKESAELRMLIL